MEIHDAGTEEQTALAVLTTAIAMTERDLAALVRAKEEHGDDQEPGRLSCGWSIFGRPVEPSGFGRRVRRAASGDAGATAIFAAD